MFNNISPKESKSLKVLGIKEVSYCNEIKRGEEIKCVFVDGGQEIDCAS